MSITKDGKTFEEREAEMAAQDKILEPMIKAWYEAKPKTLDDLQALLREILAQEHTYSSIVEACAAAALAACRTVNASEHGGITGHQAQFVLWSFVTHWLRMEGPARLVRFEDMLYPQMAEKFEKTISAETFKWLQEQAKKNLANPEMKEASESVREHWISIAEGAVPFGYKIKDAE